jgi:hypothetical protein
MKASEFVGKLAIRTAPTTFGDYSYTTEPLKILKVTENHVVVEHQCPFLKGDVCILNSRWLDDNWTSYDDLMNEVEKEEAKE